MKLISQISISQKNVKKSFIIIGLERLSCRKQRFFTKEHNTFIFSFVYNIQDSMNKHNTISTIVKILIIFFIFQTTNASGCKQGIPILTRIKNNNTLELTSQCLCPIDYFGRGCRRHRSIKCYLTKKSMNPSQLNQSNYAQPFKVELEVNAQCYIEQKPAKIKILQGKDLEESSYIPLIAFMIKRRDIQSNLDYQLESGVKGGEIIWANDTNLFYSNGRLKYVPGYRYSLDEQNRRIMSLEDEATILKTYSPLRFEYKSDFLGFPLTDSKFYITSKIIRPTQNMIAFEKKELHFVNYQEYTKLVNQTKAPQASKFQQLFKDFTINDLLNEKLYDKVKQKLKETENTIKEMSENKLLPYFKVPLVIQPRQSAELKNIRMQVSLIQNYFVDLQSQPLSVNGVQFILPAHVPGLAEAKVYSVNFNQKETPRIVYFLAVCCLIGLGYLIYSLKNRKQKKDLNKIKRHVEEMQDAIPWK